MNKLFYYEIKRSYRYLAFMAIFAWVFAIITNFIFKIFKSSSLLISLGFYLVLGVIFLINLVYFTYRYRRDLFSKSSYFTFSISISTSKIILAKLLAGLMSCFICLGLYVGAFDLINLAFGLDRTALLSFSSYALFSILLYWLLAYVFLTIGINLSKVKLFKKYYEFVSLVFSVVMLVLVMWIMRNLYRLKPLMIDLKDFSIRSLSRVNGVDFFMIYYDINNRVLGINLWILLLACFLVAFGFFINVYLVEEKIDL
ncbi:MAG: hypothetical protein PUG67_07650 [Peptoniphilaceae bacterium]|nr:hypothetical protein [Peptoniphilaceae bacterium]MDY6019317.1 hypothetical protein [Anaerococcus sp.]